MAVTLAVTSWHQEEGCHLVVPTDSAKVVLGVVQGVVLD